MGYELPEFPRVNSDKPTKVTAECGKCGGTGNVGITWVEGGVCFRCGGSGRDPQYTRWAFPQEWTDEQCAAFIEAERAKKEAARIRRWERKVAKENALYVEHIAEHPELAAIIDDVEKAVEQSKAALQTWLDESYESERKLRKPVLMFQPAIDVLDKARKWSLSPKQAQMAVNSYHRYMEQLAERNEEPQAEPVPAGKALTVEGEIVFTDVRWNGYDNVYKMLVLLDNLSKVWSTVPAQLDGPLLTELKGRRVRFVADVEASKDDPTFGIAKRPRKAEFV